MKDFLNQKKEYVLRFNNFIILALWLFLFSVILGYVVAYFYPQEVKELIDRLFEMYEPVFNQTEKYQSLFIFFNNALSLLFVSLGGLFFGIFPIVSIFSNGFILGIVGLESIRNFSLFFYLIGILPHGIIEIPVFILSSAIGLKFGYLFLNKLLKKQISWLAIRKEISMAFDFYLKILLPLLLLAAVIEIFVTGKLLKLIF